ncbi:MAG: redoxin domain-containing protein [Planctomycetales bacterium]|nr:redoxin domain-containing protein [Planctomycetales bacterium]
MQNCSFWRSLHCTAALVLMALPVWAQRPEAVPALSPDPIPDFELQDVAGATHRLSDLDGPVVIAFLGTECPLAKLYGPRLSALHRELGSKVAFLGVNSNAQDSIAEMAAYVRIHEIGFPLVRDRGAQVADSFGAIRTPEVFLLDAERRIRYRGRVDDQYGVGYVREAPTSHELRDAISALLAGRELPASTVAVGCHIGRIRKPDPEAKVTYSSHIAAIMQKHCIECHRSGEIAPFTLTEYDDVAAWAETIAEVIADGRMPPWHASTEHGEFLNAREMTDEEKRLVYDWLNAGAPLGDSAQVPPTPVFPDVSWRLGREPDDVFSMRDRPFQVPSQGTVEYQYYIVDPGFTEDKWIQAAEIVPGNRRVVHHAIVFVRPPDGVDQRGLGWLTAYVPGQNTMQLPRGMARRVPAGSKFIFQMHYTVAGSPQEDLTKVGVVYADPNAVQEEVITLMAINNQFQIPPHAADFPVHATLSRAPATGRLLAIAPHMHVRGTQFQVTSKPREGKSKVLLDVPHYDFNWQHAYRLADPLPLRDVKLECRGIFDNSEDNLVNPDANITVRWGDQTWEEMMIAFFEVAVPVGDLESLYVARPLTPQQRRRAEQSVDEMMKRWDANGDQAIAKSETRQANAFLVFAFNKLDENRDGKITREEALQHALQTERERRDRDRR